MKPILFIDFDGTLCNDRFWRSLDTEVQHKIQELIFKNSLIVKDWMTGKITSEEINEKTSSELGLNYDLIWDTFVSDCKSMRVDESALVKIHSMRNRFQLVLMTDNMDCFSRFTVPALNLDKYFDLIVNSFYEKETKDGNGGALFVRSAKGIASTVSSSVLIDNSKKTCEIFDKLGGKSYLVTEETPLLYWLDQI